MSEIEAEVDAPFVDSEPVDANGAASDIPSQPPQLDHSPETLRKQLNNQVEAQVEARVKSALAARVDAYEQRRSWGGVVLIAFPLLAFTGIAAWLMNQTELGTPQAMLLLSTALFSGACFALAARLTTRESALIKMKASPAPVPDHSKLAAEIIKLLPRR